MENANSPEYLEKIKTQVIENLKRTGFAPSMQMNDIPGDSLAAMDDAEAAEDDEDEDENKDVRYTDRRWDKRITKDAELSDSEDEELNERNGVRRQTGRPRRRNITDHPNPYAADYGMDSGMGTPEHPGSVNGDDPAADSLATAAANAEVAAEVLAAKAEHADDASSPERATEAPTADAVDGDEDGSVGSQRSGDGDPVRRRAVDAEGDVDMDVDAADADVDNAVEQEMEITESSARDDGRPKTPSPARQSGPSGMSASAAVAPRPAAAVPAAQVTPPDSPEGGHVPIVQPTTDTTTVTADEGNVAEDVEMAEGDTLAEAGEDSKDKEKDTKPATEQTEITTSVTVTTTVKAEPEPDASLTKEDAIKTREDANIKAEDAAEKAADAE